MIAADQNGLATPTEQTGPHTLLRTTQVLGRETKAWLSSEPADHAWDQFLRGTDLGQFQQSSLWARAKRMDGWQCRRLVLEQEEKIAGGFQMLWRRTRFGRIGYIIKGPVLAAEEPESISLVLDTLGGLIRSERFLALVVQPPDFSPSLANHLNTYGFVADRLMNVISATCVVNLAGPAGAWEKNMGRSKKLEARRGIRRGAVVREGSLDDIPRFFELMCATCVRQGAQPNPSTVHGLRHLVQVFHQAGAARLSFAEVEGQAVACVLDLKFGSRATAWKKGWNGAHPDKHPNTLLGYQSLQWAAGNGCRYFDFAGMGRSLAEHLRAQQPLTEEQKKDRDIFNLEFGAEPQLLPPAVIYWRHPLLRWFYRKAVASPWLAARLGRLAKRVGSS